jgi:methylene-tetrahydromethanopterin dehydrogenase
MTGIEVLNAAVLAQARKLKVAGDVNAVPPLGIEGIKLKDYSAPLQYATAATGAMRNVSIVLRHFFRKITVEASPPSPVDPACALPGRQAY